MEDSAAEDGATKGEGVEAICDSNSSEKISDRAGIQPKGTLSTPDRVGSSESASVPLSQTETSVKQRVFSALQPHCIAILSLRDDIPRLCETLDSTWNRHLCPSLKPPNFCGSSLFPLPPK